MKTIVIKQSRLAFKVSPEVAKCWRLLMTADEALMELNRKCIREEMLRIDRNIARLNYEYKR